MRSTRRAVDTLQIDIAKNLPFVVRAKGIELVSYKLDHPKNVAEVKSGTIDIDDSNNHVETVTTSSTVEALGAAIVSNSTSSTFTASNTVIDSEEVVGKGILNVPNEEDEGEEEEKEDGGVGVRNKKPGNGECSSKPR